MRKRDSYYYYFKNIYMSCILLYINNIISDYIIVTIEFS